MTINYDAPLVPGGLKEGKYYKDRTGKVWGPIERDREYFSANGEGWFWSGANSGGGPDNSDLIEEVPAPVKAPERVWVNVYGECFYESKEEAIEAASPNTIHTAVEYVRADLKE